MTIRAFWVLLLALSVLGCSPQQPAPPAAPVTPGTDAEPEVSAPAPPEPPSIVAVRRSTAVSAESLEDCIEVTSKDGQFEIVKKGGPTTVHALIGPPWEGDFEIELALRFPAIDEPGSGFANGGTALPYFGFRSTDGKKETSCHAASLKPEAVEYRFLVRREAGTISASRNGRPSQVHHATNDAPGYVFIHMNGDTKFTLREVVVQQD